MTDIVERLREKTVTPFIHGLSSELQIKEPTDLELEAADEIERLRGLLNDCANELSDEIKARYGGNEHIFSTRYDRDMKTVRAAKAALGESDE